MNISWVKSVVMVVLTAALTYLYGVFSQGSWAIDWQQLGLTTITALLAYIIKELGTSPDGSKTFGIKHN